VNTVTNPNSLRIDAAGASAADIAAARLGRSLKLWLDLQASVNGFIDSTTADKGVLVSLQPFGRNLGASISCIGRATCQLFMET
jgi:hypothetical protein